MNFGHKRVLVTGGAGYIGSHTAKALAERGCEPIVLDNLSSGHRWAVRWGPLIEGNIADASLVKAIVSKYRIEAVIHFAASAYVGESMVAPRKYFQNNVVNSLQLFHALLDSGVADIVFSSTCATYGNPVSTPIAEEHPQMPVNPYGESKLFLERALRWYAAAHGIRYVVLRYFNAAGADPAGEIGELHEPETHLLPLAIAAAHRGYPALTVYGTDHETPDGTAVRDYVHVSDLAAAHLSALDYLARQRPSIDVNLGTGKGHSVREVIRSVERVARRPIRVTPGHRRPGDPGTLVAAHAKAGELLDWSARITDLDEIVETAWRWHTADRRSRQVI